MFDGLFWCAGLVKNNFTGDCHTSDDAESIEIPGTIPVKIEDVGISFEVKPASSTHSGSRASASRLEGCLESFSEFERVESEAISLMRTELSQQSVLVDVEELLHKKPLCSTSHCQISTVQWRGQTVAMKELILGCAFRLHFENQVLYDHERDVTSMVYFYPLFNIEHHVRREDTRNRLKLLNMNHETPQH